MTTITIPKWLINKDLVLIPRDEYEAMKRAPSQRVFKTVRMTKVQKQAFERAERNYIKGKTLTLDEFRRKLGLAN